MSALASLQIPYAAPAIPCAAARTLMQAQCASMIPRVSPSTWQRLHGTIAPEDEATVVLLALITTHVTLPRCPAETH